MSDVIIAGLLMCGVAGLPIGLAIAIGCCDRWLSKVLAFIICCAMFFGIGAMMGQDNINDRNEFNNGVCVKCGGEYRFSSSTRYRMSETFYYTCQDCGWTIETNCLMNKN